MNKTLEANPMLEPNKKERMEEEGKRMRRGKKAHNNAATKK